jgi:hypothetical protein
MWSISGFKNVAQYWAANGLPVDFTHPQISANEAGKQS